MGAGQEMEQAADAVNEVRLVGRVSARPERRELPGGDSVIALRVIVRRPEAARRGTQTVDAIECTVWRAQLARTVARWEAGDLVEVSGAIRRRFYSAAGRTLSSVQVEVATGRIIRRAAAA
ncbi:MAG: single-stranded DNA-binding protein [Nocardioides sp.]|uniref:single-stranded DNA-binding protein n=1 Tax=Nocardioides sp. TaxID=35761 RepID=UPI0039E70933